MKSSGDFFYLETFRTALYIASCRKSNFPLLTIRFTVTWR